MSEHTLQVECRVPDDSVRQTEEDIAWILAHPAFSDWLKAALRSAITCEHLQVANDLELLNHLVRRWSLARIDAGQRGAQALPKGSKPLLP